MTSSQSPTSSGASKFFESTNSSKADTPAQTKPNGRTVKPIGSAVRPHRSDQATGSTSTPTVATELTEGRPETPTRPTQRYAFEVYTDQRRRINDVQARYQIETGRKLSASRIIREALDEYLEQLEVQLNRL